jgi:hypothetical protein
MIHPKIAVCMILFVFLAGCSTAMPEPTSTQTLILPTATLPLAVTFQPAATPTVTSTTEPTPYPTTPAQATIEVFGPLCANANETLDSEIAPGGKWISAECFRENNTEDSPLRVVNSDRSRDWKIYFRDYTGAEYGAKNIFIPYRWSKDGKYLYAVSPTIASGCCWIGGEYVLLVRLNLETGEQDELLSPDQPITFTLSEDDRYLLFTPPTYQPYDFAILDLVNRKTRTLDLKFSGDLNLAYAVISPSADKILLPLFEQLEFNNFKVKSIALIDLTTEKQKLLISDLKPKEELYPVRWVDADRVLMSDLPPGQWHYQATPKYWLLNINSAQMIETQGP